MNRRFFRPAVASFRYQVRVNITSLSSVLIFIFTPIIFGSVSVLFLSSYDAPELTRRAVIGSGIVAVWTTSLMLSNITLAGERWSGVAELFLATPSRLGTMMLGKLLANALQGVLAAFLAIAVITAIHEAGGDVLKLIGDGTLALFRADDPAEAARRALQAEEILRTTHRAQGREPAGEAGRGNRALLGEPDEFLEREGSRPDLAVDEDDLAQVLPAHGDDQVPAVAREDPGGEPSGLVGDEIEAQFLADGDRQGVDRELCAARPRRRDAAGVAGALELTLQDRRCER